MYRLKLEIKPQLLIKQLNDKNFVKQKQATKTQCRNKNDRHEGFARGHPPYYWPRLSTLNFLDLTG